MLVRGIAVAVFVVGAVFHASGRSARAATVSIDPSSLTSQAGQSFSVDVQISGVSDLLAWQFDVDFDPTLLAATGVTEGPFLANGGNTTSFSPGTIDNTAGIIASSSDVVLTGTGVTGSGVLATVSFQALAAGTSAIDLANVTLSDSEGNILADTSNGLVDVTAVVPEPSALVVSSAIFAIFGGLWSYRRLTSARVAAVGCSAIR